MYIVKLLPFLLIINFCLFPKLIDNRIENPYIIAIMVEFKEEETNDPLTSGNGNFLDESFNIDIIWNNNNTQRCDNYLVDRPPHNSLYFSSQIEALKNYYITATKGNVIISGEVLLSDNEEDGYYRLDKYMKDYAYSDNGLALLFKESLELAENDIKTYLENNPDINIDDIIFTVFHAGIGQDFTFPTFDPTIYDIKSAYIESSMFSNNDYPIIDGYEINSGILLPETQNMIYFDSIEDIFYGNDDYCDFQLGLTGTFSFLMGYALGLPPLFNTESGKPGVGVFGLMDYGAHNGRGVIPAMPSPWTRILKDWEDPINMTDSSQINPLIFDIESNNIYKFNISEKEYFLIENHSSTLSDGTVFQNIINVEGPWFDSIIDSDLDIFTFSQDSSVITNVSNYDFGFPGSGILIWHIDEPSNIDNPINNNRYNKAVAIEEADGANDIGFESYALFSNDDPTNGTKWDFWFLGNDAYSYTNNQDNICYNEITYDILDYTYQYECEVNNGIWIETLIFDKYSNPNSNLNDKINSFFSFELMDSISSNIKRVKVKYESPINYTDYTFLLDYKVIGSSIDNIFFSKDMDGNNEIYSFDLSNGNFELRDDLYQNIQEGYQKVVITDSNDQSSSFQYRATDGDFYYFNNDDELILTDQYKIFGYFNDTETPNYINIEWFDENNFQFPSIDYMPYISSGDIDDDGLDEIVWISDGQILAANFNGTLVNNFPIDGNYSGAILILEKEDNDIILALRNNNHIEILSLSGDVLHTLPSIGGNDIMSINGKLTDGVRFYDFPVNDGSCWLQKYSSHSHYLFSLRNNIIPNYDANNKKITKFYNYPNPIINRETKFRFMVHEQANIVINIFTITGIKVDQLNLSNLVINDYNEIVWNTASLKSGLYFAEIKANGIKENIIKVVIGQ